MADPLVADLVLEGGGVKGIALVGALSELEARGYRFNRVAGASAGAIVGSLVAAGYSTTEMHDIMAEIDYRKFRDRGFIDRLGFPGKVISVIFEQGIYEGRYLSTWLADLLAQKGKTTFADMKVPDPDSLEPEQQYRLVVMASDISQGCLRKLPWDYHHYAERADEARVVDAVRASMSIPLFYEPVKFQNNEGRDCWLVDGGMLSNFPIDTFDCSPDRAPRWPTFGIKLSAKAHNAQQIINDVHDTPSMLSAMVATLTGFHDQIHLDDPAVTDRTIFVDTTGVNATDFDIDKDTQEQLFEAGRHAAIKFLDGDTTHPGWDWQRYLANHRLPQTAAAA
jgi:NTE family protein